MNNKEEIKWYKLSVNEAVKELRTDINKGLTKEKIDIRHKKYGRNVFDGEKKDTVFDMIFKQVKSPLVFILIIALLGAFFLGEYLDALVIFIAVSINVIIGVFQENKASGAFEKLVQSQEKYATVIREGKKSVIKATDLVTGDIVHIEAGMYVPADIRVIKQNNLSVNESALTGEWVSVSKDIKKIEHDEPVTGQTNMLWMGTLVSAGKAMGVVVSIGKNTEIGFIAKNLAYTEDTHTPLQESIKKLAKFLAKFTLISVIIILVIGILRGEGFAEMLLVSIALAVAIMPEGMPAALTVVLALGMEAILKKGGLVRNLLAAETLGSTTVILTDKTGTLTLAEMRVRDIITPCSLNTKNEDKSEEEKELFSDGDKRTVLNMALLTSDAFVEGKEDETSPFVVRGRPVERAIVFAGLDVGINQEDLSKEHTQVDFLPFESKRRFVASLNKTSRANTNRLYISGAPELLLGYASYCLSNGKKIKLTDKTREKLSLAKSKEASKGMRIIGIAYKDLKSDEKLKKTMKDSATLLKDIVFSGFIVLHDPIREDVPDSIRIAKEAGARVIMLTGDNPETATKIATEAGIKSKNSIVLSGTDIEKYTDEELLSALKKTDVFARVLPEQKLHIARLLKGAGEVVAMTGDGINDAPALRSADIGIALGSGTEVAKEASDIILMNDSFSIIVDAIEEGRRILDNLKKIVAYLISTGFSELVVITSALLIGAPLPFLPAQILWVNILQEGFMNFAFAFEPKENDVMKRNSNNVAMKGILTRKLKKLIALIAITTGLFLVILYFYLISIKLPIEKVRTLMFIALSVGSIFFSFSIKNLRKPIWKIDLFSNRYLLFSFSLSLFMLIMSLVFAPLRALLSLSKPSAIEFSLIFFLGAFNLIVIELVKYIVFERKTSNRLRHNLL